MKTAMTVPCLGGHGTKYRYHDGRQTQCRKCRKEGRKRWAKTHAKHLRKYAREYARRRRGTLPENYIGERVKPCPRKHRLSERYYNGAGQLRCRLCVIRWGRQKTARDPLRAREIWKRYDYKRNGLNRLYTAWQRLGEIRSDALQTWSFIDGTLLESPRMVLPCVRPS